MKSYTFAALLLLTFLLCTGMFSRHRLIRGEWYLDRNLKDSAAFFSADTLIFININELPGTKNPYWRNPSIEFGYIWRNLAELISGPHDTIWPGGSTKQEFYAFGYLGKYRVSLISKTIEFKFLDERNAKDDRLRRYKKLFTRKYRIVEYSKEKLILVPQRE